MTTPFYRSTDLPVAYAVRGGAVRGMRDGFGPFQRLADQLLIEAGISEWSDETFTPVGAIMRFFELVEARFGPEIIGEIGKQEVRYLPLTSVKMLDYFRLLPALFAAQHTGPPHGGVSATILSPLHLLAWSSTPYPCELESGIFTGIFLFYEVPMRIIHSVPCRRDGAFACLWRFVSSIGDGGCGPSIPDLCGLS